MANEKLRSWMKEHNVSDTEIMFELGLTSANQFQNRMCGRTPFSPLERRSLSAFTGLSEAELFERGTK